MKHEVRSFLFILAIFSWLQVPHAWCVDEPQLKTILVGRDNQLDNAVLRYRVIGTMKVEAGDFLAAEAAGLSLKPIIPQNPIDVIYNEECVVRGADITVSRSLDPALVPEKFEAGKTYPIAGTKWCNAGGMTRMITYAYNRERPENDILEISPYEPYSVDNNFLPIQLTLGFGIGSRLQKVDSIAESPEGTEFDGVMAVLDVEARCHVSLDANFIVRRATIKAFGPQTGVLYEVETFGVVQSHGVWFAREATFRSSRVAIRDGQIVGSPKIVLDYRVEFGEIEPDLSDDTYHNLISMDVRDGTSIHDTIAGISYRAGDNSQESNALYKLKTIESNN